MIRLERAAAPSGWSRARDECCLLIPALAFTGLGFVALVLRGRPAALLLAPAFLAAGSIAAHVWLNRAAPDRDPLLFPAAIVLTGWGMLTIARVAPNFLARQLAWFGVALLVLCAVAASRDRLRWLRRFKYTWLGLALALLAATLVLGVNPIGAGARLWLSVGGLFMQPSEVLRLLMIAFLAAFFSERLSVHIGQWTTRPPPTSYPLPPISYFLSPISYLQLIAPSILMWLIAAALLGTQQDLGAAALLMATFLFMLYLASGKALFPLLGLAGFAVAGAIGASLSARVAQRIGIWLNPWADPHGAAFQIVQSLISLASGGVFGQGIGQGQPDYVPAVHTDFPFAAVGEEFGLIGTIGLLLVFAILILRAWQIARRSRDAYGLLLAGGLAGALAIQVFVIVGGNLGIVPLTGVTLPFVSYGGSSLFVSFVEVGLLIRLSADQAPDGFRSATQRHTPTRPLIVVPFVPTAAQRRAARQAMFFSTGLVVAAAIVAGYWSVVQAGALTARDDNPRRVVAEHAIERGAILASDGTPLALSAPGEAYDDPGTPVPYIRHYPHVEAAPVIGYYSLRHGTGGIEAYADAVLRGRLSPFDQLLHRQQVGAPFTTTIDLALQVRAFSALSGATGAAVIIDWRTGNVLALVSAPSFDPNTLDDQWDSLRASADAPLLNRATQGLYQPGALLAWLQKNAEHRIQNTEYRTQNTEHEESGIEDPLQLGTSVPFELENAAVPYPATLTYSETIGQGTLRITPLRVATAVAALVAGRPVTPTLAFRPAGTAQVEPPDTNRRPFGISEPVILFAQMGTNRHVGWSIVVDGGRVIVVALEQLDTSPGRISAIRDTLRSALP